MKKYRFFILFCICAIINTISAQEAKQTTNMIEPICFNIRGGIGGNYMVSFYQFGVATNIGGYAEIPLSKKYNNWKFSPGMRLTNKNIGLDNNNVSLLFKDFPFLFSYDFHLSQNNKFRIEIGPYYSQYIGGGIFKNKINIANPFRNVYNSPCNIGLIIGAGIYYGNFYMGCNFEYLWDYINYESDFLLSLTTTIGYRF